MPMQTSSGIGKLYDADGKNFITNINYQIYERPETQTTGEWRGSFIPDDQRLYLGGEYLVELKDGRKGKILITNVKTLPGFPNYYEFKGIDVPR
ncbi:MAG: hypothetical protein HY665_07785 [Chloroflexi bacterium]|nr:hypothetical protein [Chloroflexota bacterium]